jgi:hypothetical protein
MKTQSTDLQNHRRLLAVCFAVASVVVSAIPVSAQATFGGANGKIAYSSTHDGSRDIWVKNGDGSGPAQNLTGAATGMGGTNEDWPVWSSDGAKLAFQRDMGGGNFDIYVMNGDGSGTPQNITNSPESDQNPTWSPDNWIAYTRTVGGNADIWKRKGDGTGTASQITTHAAQDTHPSWDTGGGGTIAFISNRSNNIFQLFIMNPDGNNQTPQLSGQEEFNPNWSPGADKLMFDRNVNGNFDVVSRNWDGGGCCINWSSPFATEPAFDVEPTWSPDGTKFAWSSTRTGFWEIHTQDLVLGAPASNFTQDPGAEDRNPDWGRVPPKIVVVKNSIPDDPQDFSFSAGGGLNPSSFSLDDDADGTLSNTRTYASVPAGSGYSLSESVPSGWDQTSATCNDGSPVSNISVSHNETVTCTFTNRKRGRIVVVKNATPDDPQDFAFTAGGGLSPSSFSLDDDNDGTLSNTRTFNDVVPAGGYSLAESVPSGWDQTAATCDDGSPISNINVAAGETVTCTFANRKRGQIVAVKDATPDDSQNFSFSAGGGLSPTGFQLDDDSDPTLSNTRTFTNVVPGSGYSLSETVPSGWDQTTATCDDGSPVSNINLAAGEIVTCTFNNRKHANLVVVKNAQPDDPQDFAFTAGGGLSPSSFSLDDDSDGTLSNTRTFGNVPPGGGYSLSESVPSSWDQTSATCDDGSPISNVSLTAGETVTCTFTNRKRGNIVVVKDARPNDPQDFSFTAGGGLSPGSFQLDDDSDGAHSNTRTFSNLVPGAGYSLSETVPSGWRQDAATCSDGSPVGNIDVSAGETVTCTYVNIKLNYPRPLGATPLAVPLVLAYEECTAPNSSHPAPIFMPSCVPPEQTSDYLTVGTANANGQPTKSQGRVRMEVVTGNPATPQDEADIGVIVSMTDVRNQSDLSDYSGELRLITTMRLTDKGNGGSGTDPGTVQDFPYSFFIECSATADTTIGGDCGLATTIDALAPNAVVEGRRSILKLGEMDVYDGGADGDASTEPNTLFAWQGLFTP